MDHRRVLTMECRTLPQSFLPAERETGVAQGPHRVRRAAPHRAGGGNNVRLRTRIFRLLHQAVGLPLRRVRGKGQNPPVAIPTLATTVRRPLSPASSRGVMRSIRAACIAFYAISRWGFNAVSITSRPLSPSRNTQTKGYANGFRKTDFG